MYHKITESDLAGWTVGKDFAMTTRDGGKRLEVFVFVDSKLKINTSFRVLNGPNVVYDGRSGKKAIKAYNDIPK